MSMRRPRGVSYHRYYVVYSTISMFLPSERKAVQKEMNTIRSASASIPDPWLPGASIDVVHVPIWNRMWPQPCPFCSREMQSFICCCEFIIVDNITATRHYITNSLQTTLLQRILVMVLRCRITPVRANDYSVASAFSVPYARM